MHTQARTRTWQFTLVLLYALLWQSANTQIATAHSIDRLLRAEGVKVGEHTLTVWTSPSRLRPGEVHVDIQVMQADGTLATSPFVQVVIMPQTKSSAGAANLPQQAVARPLTLTRTDRNTATHEARFRLDHAGDYSVTVVTADAQGQVAEVSFTVAVTPVPLALTLTLHMVLAGSLVMSAWVVRMGLRVWQPARARQLQRV